ncbi:GNAT family N-acetyltransferase [Fodinicola acaciae]|uniref:GNAT family N-acetyltransferase n=1 Tax=Fodinicola acaciae TaxID=2681555 RepID=UPI0013D1A81E|nr:N-acetyltransferase [Fodinicola acaciae]
MDTSVIELERIAMAGWPGLELATLGEWRLRAASGFTGRGNSALPLGSPGLPSAEAVSYVRDWYFSRGLPAMVQVPLPARADLVPVLEDAGFTRAWGALVLTAPVSAVLALPERTDLPAVSWSAEPGADWLSLYHYRGGELPSYGVDVLKAGASPAFGTLVSDGEVAGICRTSVSEGWVGLTAVEVSAAYRRRGLATHLLRSAAAVTPATSVYLQVEHSNEAALALYKRTGFTQHHEYFYWRLPRA